MLQKIVLGAIWLLLIIYTIGFTPPSQPDTLDLIIKLYTGQWSNINFLVISLFWILTILPIIYASLLLIESKEQKIPAYPFIIASFVLGIYALLPYFSLRQSNTNWNGKKNWLLKIIDSRLIAILLTIAITIFTILGFIYGNLTDFIWQFKTSQLINLMTWDFLLLCLSFPLIIKDDLRRRGINKQNLLWLLIYLPLFGTLIYLCLKPTSLSESQENYL